MSEFLDELARTLAKPMPRRRALKLLGGAMVSVAAPAIVARPARAAPQRHGGGMSSRGVWRPLHPGMPRAPESAPPRTRSAASSRASSERSIRTPRGCARRTGTRPCRRPVGPPAAARPATPAAPSPERRASAAARSARPTASAASDRIAASRASAARRFAPRAPRAVVGPLRAAHPGRSPCLAGQPSAARRATRTAATTSTRGRATTRPRLFRRPRASCA